MTRSSATLSLFAEPSGSGGRPSSFALSIVAHLAVAGVVWFAVTHLPKIQAPSLKQRYSVRQLDLRALDPDFPNLPEVATEEQSKIPYPGRDVVEQMSGGLTPDLADAMRAFIASAPGHQTLIQPELQTHLSFAEQVPLPTLMIWTPEHAPQKTIVPPAPNPPTASNTKPSTEAPNQEIKLADVSMSSTNLSPRTEAMPAGTTSPVEISI